MSDSLAVLLENTQRLSAVTSFMMARTEKRQWWNRVTEAAMQLTCSDATMLNVVNGDDVTMVVRTGVAKNWPPANIPIEQTYCQHVVSGQQVCISDSRTDPLVREATLRYNIPVRAYLGAPIIVQGLVVASLCTLAMTPRDWTPGEIEGMWSLAGLVQA